MHAKRLCVSGILGQIDAKLILLFRHENCRFLQHHCIASLLTRNYIMSVRLIERAIDCYRVTAWRNSFWFEYYTVVIRALWSMSCCVSFVLYISTLAACRYQLYAWAISAIQSHCDLHWLGHFIHFTRCNTLFLQLTVWLPARLSVCLSNNVILCIALFHHPKTVAETDIANCINKFSWPLMWFECW
jgi:hypothetical protein